MKELNLYRIWEIVNKLQDKMDELSEDNIYVYLLGYRSNYVEMTFESFLNNYSFKVEDNIVIYNDDPIPWEDYTNNDFMSIPKKLVLSMTDQEIDEWAEEEIKNQLNNQAKEKQTRKENILLEIERLNREYNRL